MPQNEHMELWTKRHGKQLDHDERTRKREARSVKKQSRMAKKLRGLKAKMYNKKRYKEKAAMKKMIKMHTEKNSEHSSSEPAKKGAVPAYLMEREGVSTAKILSNSIKQKRKEKAGRWAVPLPKVRTIAEAETFKVMRTGKRKRKSWKRLVNKVTFVGPNFTRKPPKFERFIRPAALRFKKAHICHPDLQTTFCLEILAVKKNPQSAMHTGLGVITKGTILEVNVSELGLVTSGGKVVWGKYAQVTNNPECDGCINGVLLV